jgi:tRNA1Val (adenine37-N6)-methyltransferase
VFLYQPSNGYCYNSDSIFLYNFICDFQPKGKLLDVGCGVGILSLLLSRDFPIDTTVVDKQAYMLRYAKRNFALNHLTAHIHLGDFATLQLPERYHYIISNPPFYDSDVTQSENESLNMARYAHHLPLESFILNVKKHLHPRGWFLCCYDAKQVDRLIAILKQNKLNVEVLQFVHSKIDRESKLVMVAARLNSKSMTKILPPFIVFDEESRYLSRAINAFKRANTHSIKAEEYVCNS